MKQEILPAIVTTRQSLDRALTGQWSVIYIDNSLYRELQKNLAQIMGSHGYAAAEKPGLHGVFFLKSHGHNAFDPVLHRIYDPMNIL